MTKIHFSLGSELTGKGCVSNIYVLQTVEYINSYRIHISKHFGLRYTRPISNVALLQKKNGGLRQKCKNHALSGLNYIETLLLKTGEGGITIAFILN